MSFSGVLIPALGNNLFGSSPNGNYVLWGDSFTASSTGYGGKFALLYPNVNVSNQGIGGQPSGSVAARMNAVPVQYTLPSNQIAGSGGTVCTIVNSASDPFYHWDTTYGSINGYFTTSAGAVVPGILSWTGSTTTFTPKTALGSAATVPNPATFVVTSTCDTTSVSAIGVTALNYALNSNNLIWAGRNDVYYGLLLSSPVFPYSQATTLANIAAMVAAVGSSRFMVMGIPLGEAFLTSARSTQGIAPNDAATIAACNAVASLNAALKALYGPAGNYFDVEAYYLSTGMYNSWTISGNTYLIPNQTLLPDGVHPTGTGQQVALAYAINQAWLSSQSFNGVSVQTILPNNPLVQYTDYVGTVTKSASAGYFTRPSIPVNANYTCAPASRIRIYTNSSSVSFNTYFTGLISVPANYNDKTYVLVNNVPYQFFQSNQTSTVTMLSNVSTNVQKLPSGYNVVELLLPFAASIELVSINILAGASIAACPARPSAILLACGESVTQGFYATTALTSYPTLLAGYLGAQVANGGYGSNTVNVGDMTKLCNAVPAAPSYWTYYADYNDWNSQTAIATFTSNYEAEINNGRAINGNSLPLYCITWTYSSATGKTIPLSSYRTAITTALAALANNNNIPVNGLMLVPNSSTYFPQDPHPNQAGHTLFAQNLYQIMIGNIAASFVSIQSHYLSISSNSTLQLGSTSFTVWGWINMNLLPTGTSLATLISKASANTAAGVEYEIYYDANTSHLTFRTSTGSTLSTAVNTATIAASTWYFVVAEYNSGTSTMSLAVNNGTAATQGSVASVQATTGQLCIGVQGGEGAGYMDGAAAMCGVTKRLLTSGEQTSLYNAGAGVTYANAPSSIKDASLVAYWNLNETNGNRNDSTANANNLTQNNNILVAAAP